MSYQRITCPKGHSFYATIYGKSQRVSCPQCRQQHQTDQSYSAANIGPSPTFDYTPSTDHGSPSSDSFSSGGGGDFSGGGASGSWD